MPLPPPFPNSRSGKSQGPLISMESCSIAVPASLLGTVVGVTLNAKIPDAELVLLLTVILFHLTVWVGWNAFKMYREERLGDPFSALLSVGRPPSTPGESPQHGGGDAGAGGSAVVAETKSPRHWDTLSMLVLLLLVVVFGILRELSKRCHDSSAAAVWWQYSEEAAQADIEHCDHPFLRIVFWGTVRGWTTEFKTHYNLQRVCVLVPTVACLAYGEASAQRASNSMPMLHIRMTQFFLFFLGVVGSLAGVGPGIALSPFFFMLGHNPRVTVATSTTCVIFISASSALQYIITNRVKMALAFVYSLTNITASCVGVFGIHVLADTWARPSFIMATICFSVAVSFMISLGRLIQLVA
mmetsp:Transcript_121631/g.344688  ORF Transcript_121631/g.344688 Transcript_121631/m.344688 type:complete len:356 (-) Transcript_121631:30-1097(-)